MVFNIYNPDGSKAFSIENGDASTEANVVGTVARVANTVSSGGGVNLATTIINKIVSLGTFSTVKELLDSVGKKAKQAAGSNPASIEDVKQWMDSGNGEFKSGAAHWWLNGMQVGDKATNIPKGNMRIVESNGCVIGLMKMKFGRNTTDASGLFDQQLVLVNTFVGSGSNIKAVKVGRCYLKGRDKNLESAESFLYNDNDDDMFYDTEF